MGKFDPDDSQAQEDLPPGLKAELVRMQEPFIPVPGELDEQILNRAKQSFHRRRVAWTWMQRVGVGLAAAAVLAIAVRIFAPGLSASHGPIQRPQLARLADVNADGRVDILDAFTVARSISRHQSPSPAWDVNADGVVDQKDVDLIATLAVQAHGEKPQ